MKTITTTLIKTISIDSIKNCMLYEMKGFDRNKIADCGATINIYKDEHIVNNNNKFSVCRAILVLDNEIIVRKDIDIDSILMR